MIGKRYPSPFLFVLLLPGMLLAVLALRWVSQQANARENRIRKDLRSRLLQCRDDAESKARDLLRQALQQVTRQKITGQDSDTLLALIKDASSQQAVIKYPFVVSADGKLIFPFPRKTLLPAYRSPDLAAQESRIASLYLQAKKLETKQYDYATAIHYYLRCLKLDPPARVVPYLEYAIANAYFQWGKFSQAAFYYRRVDEHANKLKLDPIVHFTALRQLALSERDLQQTNLALATYLRLYKKIVSMAGNEAEERFAILRNEASEFIRNNSVAKNAAAAPIPSTTPLDTWRRYQAVDERLSWVHFENTLAGEDRPGEFRYLRLNALFRQADEKYRFYHEIGQLRNWSAKSSADFTLRWIQLSADGQSGEIAFQEISRNPQQAAALFFGFLVADDSLQRLILPQLAGRDLGWDTLQLAIVVDREWLPVRADNAFAQPLLAVPFTTLLPGKALAIYARTNDFFSSEVQKELRWNYALIASLILLLLLGGFLFYKYFQHESELLHMKAEFLDRTAHTLKTPLTRMALLAENVSQGWVTDERQQREYIHTIMREVGQMNEQINQLLDFSRIESGRKPYLLKTGDLAETVNLVLKEFSGRIRQAGFILETEIASGLPALSFDAEAIRLILVNLLQNALKYSEKEKYIRVRLFRDGAQAVIEVADQGIGMAAQELRRIFERFHRAEDARVRAREGSGLGLFLVQHAVTAHQGRVTVSSRPDAGSIFTVYLPLKNNKQKQVHS